jgi:hypothetical protein
VPDAPAPTQLDHSPARVFSWAAYLACSWTWCIGMFLPVLLWRDFGVWGFLIFAIPNIVGAAEMGFLLARPGSSERFVAAHAAACRLFSVVTLAFQAFFLIWILRMVAGPAWLSLATVVLAAIAAAGVGIASVEWRREAVLTWVVSVVIAAVFITRRGGVEFAPSPSVAPLDLAGLAAVCALGFIFCPYLDLTFHTARRSTAPGPGKAAFALGFGVLFAAMIAFTAVYAAPMLNSQLGSPGSLAGKVAFISLLGHIVMQLLFTIAVHSSELQDARAGKPGWGGAAAFIVGAALGAAAGFDLVPAYAGLSGGELLYRCFMAFYGLVFPAYVWICSSPIARTSPPTRRMLATWLAAMAAATPFYWLGFIERDTWWLLPGVAIVLAARFFRGGPERESAETR